MGSFAYNRLCGFLSIGTLTGLVLTLLASGPAAAPQISAENLSGKLLVATPHMSDPRFARSVVFILRHDIEGAMGLIINRQIGSGPLLKFLKGLGVEDTQAQGDITLYYGGPMEPYLTLMLHSSDYAIAETLTIDGIAAMSGGLEVLKAVSEGKGPNKYIFTLGYAGWGSGQLEHELQGNSWVVVPADEEILFDGDVEEKWERAYSRRKIDL
ncbi:MAG: hypothetical protein HOO00_00655 [Rhodospirillaceae bacterium]|jgi:putative transcriptional regulator|nr:hypothetical protein [Rhodospirillaceae bacterium]MBT5373235.1 hypothetical protein [Rhodospirillaceae bacterium]MBT5753084.1 hypothetical protein [Rhodospirillaceae bacterium]